MENPGDSYRVLLSPAQGLFKDRGSRFLAYAFPVTGEEAFKKELERLRKEHHGARHHCYAFRLSPESGIYRYSDDGEPSGTAGRPIYEQICAAGLYDTAVVVVRYFGGVLLGTGGLHNAYKQAAAAALATAETGEKILQDTLILTFGYGSLNRVMQIIDREHLTVTGRNSDTSCRLILSVPRSETERITERFSRAGEINVAKA